MSYLEYNVKRSPSGFRKVLHVNWALVLLLAAVASIGFLQLYSVSGGNFERWTEPQMQRFALALAVMFAIGFVPLWFWRSLSVMAYGVSFVLLLGVEFFGSVGMGAQRWLELGPIRLQPSEMMKIAIVMMMAAYYDWLDIKRVSHPFWVLVAVALILVPSFLVLIQPDLGTALMIIGAGGMVMFFAGVSLWYFGGVIGAGAGLVTLVFASRGTSWQLLRDYQFRRIDAFLDPSLDPLGSSYHINQAMIALGSGGWSGRGFMQGTQSRLNFLPEKHTDFIFNTLAEEFGFIGGIFLLTLYVGIIVTCVIAAMQSKNRYASLLILGIAGNFFLYFAINMAMVMGLAPVVGVPLPLVSYGGSAMLMILIGFGLVQSACIHRPREKA
ncbi:rod shape-determining protein RodA [Pararhodobacter aggregans]|uniref:Peptidoglycan glycosyltransferase MrdB n=1 Tax=Pararhodobacter aggregans TaxID=404875 RepID=A0A2T7UX63_9RHOB|nr:rod shape-determining protein RodA [Pararhodobacter aggregans]PTX05052.1 rod shape determining protein RodA [Pararhodobacter aggregans]PVE49365.1 rod shape-determining protein RodA [Pararhodobacter aggregans]